MRGLTSGAGRFARLAGTAAIIAALGLPSGHAILRAGAAQDDGSLPSTTSSGDTLTSAQTTTLLQKIKDGLDAKGVPSGWVDQLMNDLPGVKFDSDIGDNQALYYPAWNTIYLKPGLDLTTLTPEQLATITHESWHAWFDFVPVYPFSRVSRFSDAQDEAIGGFIDELVGGGNMTAAVSRAITEATGQNRGGTAQDAVDAIDALERSWVENETFFDNPFPTQQDVNRWVVLRRTTPEIVKLENLFWPADRQRIQDRIDELARRDAEPEPEPEPEPAPTPTTSGAGTGTGTTTAPTPVQPAPTGGASAGGQPQTAPAPEPTSGTTAGGQMPAPATAPVCDPCRAIAARLQQAQQALDNLKAESAKVDARLTALRGGELQNAQNAFDQLSDEYNRRLGDPTTDDIGKRGTFISDGTQEVRYQEAGGVVNIVTIRGGNVVPGSARRSPYMSALKARMDAAKAKLEALQAEEGRLAKRRQELDAELPKAQQAVDALRKELDDCLKLCGYSGTTESYLQMPGPLGPNGGAAASQAFLTTGKHLLDFIGPWTFSAVGPDGVPYSIARRDLAVDERYQYFIILSVRVRTSQVPDLPANQRQGRIERDVPRWASVARDIGDFMLGALRLVAPGRQVRSTSAARFAPGTIVRLGDAPQAAAAPRGLSIAATGSSSGEAFTLEVFGPSGEPMQVLAPAGLVLQPVREAVAPRAIGGAGAALRTSLDGFCLDFHKPPPPAGQQYIVAPEPVQTRYRSMRQILEAAQGMAKAGLLNPDSDPAGYATFVQQWSLWTKLENWNYGDFAREFEGRTRRNAENAGVRWTDEMRDAVRGAARNRFNDILAVLLEAEGLGDS